MDGDARTHTAHTTGVDTGDQEDSSLRVQLNGVNVTLCIVSWLVALNYCFQGNEVAVLEQKPSHVVSRLTKLPAHTNPNQHLREGPRLRGFLL